MRKSKFLNRSLVSCLALILVLVMMPAALGAGETMTMDELYFSIMPEYDAMNVIVVSSGNFINDTGKAFQGEITWLMPKGARVFMVCETERGMVCREYVIDDKSDPNFDKVVWKPSREIKPGEKFPVMFEYTMHNFTAPGERKFTVPFQSTFPVKNMTVEFKQPKNSSNLVLNPASTQTAQDDEGFTNYYYSYDQVNPQEKLSFEVSYTRNETKPSKEPAQGNNAAGGEQQSGGSSLNSTVVVLLAAFLVLLAAFMFLALRGNSGKAPARNSKSGGHKPRSPQRQVAATAPAEPKPKQAKARAGRSQEVQEEKKKIRKMLLDGKISEETYRQLIAEIDED